MTDNNLNEVFKERVAELSIGERNLALLDGEEQDKKYLDLGFVDDRLPESKETIVHNATARVFWYYGNIIKGKQAIITSDKKIHRNTLEKFYNRLLKTTETIGHDEIADLINYDGYIGEIAPLMSKEAIKRYFISKTPLDKRKVFRDVVEKILYYMDFGEQESIAYVQACWIIATHCYPLFYWFAHILFNAPSESGKSKNAFIMTQMAFRGFDLGTSAGVTPPQIFRTIECNRGTIWIDEFEKQEKSESQQLSD